MAFCEVKNCKTRCEGLAPELFVFSAFGTTTYVLSVCAKSIEKDYLMVNASWLVGQGLTAVLDCIVRLPLFLCFLSFMNVIDRSLGNSFIIDA